MTQQCINCTCLGNALARDIKCATAWMGPSLLYSVQDVTPACTLYMQVSHLPEVWLLCLKIFHSIHVSVKIQLYYGNNNMFIYLQAVSDIQRGWALTPPQYGVGPHHMTVFIWNLATQATGNHATAAACELPPEERSSNVAGCADSQEGRPGPAPKP